MASEEGFHQATTTLQMLQYQIEEMRNIKMLRNYEILKKAFNKLILIIDYILLISLHQTCLQLNLMREREKFLLCRI